MKDDRAGTRGLSGTRPAARAAPRVRMCLSLIAVVGLSFAASGPAAGQPSTDPLTFAEDTAVEVTLDEKDPTVVVTLRNASAETIRDLVFHALVEREKIPLEATGSTLGGGEVGQFEVTFPRDSFEDGDEGFFVAKGGGVPAATRPLAVTEVEEQPSLPMPLVLTPLVVAIVIVFARWGFMKDKLIPKLQRPPTLDDRLGEFKWKIDESWLSSVTAIGGILGTVLADAILPEDIPAFPKAEFTGLNVFFLIVIAAAGFIFLVFGKAPSSDTNEEIVAEGTVVGFLVASALTLWAVLGELGVLGALLWVLRDQGSLGSTEGTLLVGLVAAMALLVTVYAWRAIRWTIERKTAATERLLTYVATPVEEREAIADQRPARPRVGLL